MWKHYLRSALRNIRRHPLSAAIKLAALSLGLVCFLTAYVFAAFIDRADTHWERSDRIYFVTQYMAGPTGQPAAEPIGAGAPVAKTLRLDFPELEAVARVSGVVTAPRTDGPDRDRTVRLSGADPEILDIFDFDFAAGNADEALSRPGSAILTASAARRMFGGDDPIGQTLSMEFSKSTTVTVTAVIADPPAPSLLGKPFGEFDMLVTMDAYDDLLEPNLQGFGDDADSFARAMRPSEMGDWTRNIGLTFVLLPENGALTAEAMERRLVDFVAQRAPEDARVASLGLERPQAAVARGFDRWMTSDQQAQLSLRWTLYGLGALVLAVACLNFANLATAEAAARTREVGLRKTVGAGRRHIAAQALTETGLLTAASAVLTLIVIALILRSAPLAQLGVALPSLARPGFWLGILAVLAAVALAAGAYPSLVLANVRPQAAQRMGGGGGGWSIRTLMIGVQFIAAAALLTGVAVIWLQNMELRRTGLGAMEDPIVIGNTSFPGGAPANDVFQAEAEAHSGVAGYTAMYGLPFTLNSGGGGQLELRLAPGEDAPARGFQEHSVRWNFFDVIGADFVAGRDFSAGDSQIPSAEERGDGPIIRGAIIDAGTAERLGFTPEEAIGQRLYLSRAVTFLNDGEISFGRNDTQSEVIGVISDPPFELRAGGPDIHVYQTIYGDTGGVPLARLSRENVSGGLAHLEDVMERLVPDTAVEFRFLDEAFDQAFSAFNWLTRVLVALCLMALVIAAMGLFGLASFVVRQRQREIGVRKTLGATRAGVLGQLIWDFSKPVLVANLIAWPLAYIASQAYLNLFVTRIGLTPWPFLASLTGSLLIAWAAVGLQSWRAAQTKPAGVLRTE